MPRVKGTPMNNDDKMKALEKRMTEPLAPSKREPMLPKSRPALAHNAEEESLDADDDSPICHAQALAEEPRAGAGGPILVPAAPIMDLEDAITCANEHAEGLAATKNKVSFKRLAGVLQKLAKDVMEESLCSDCIVDELLNHVEVLYSL